MWEAHFWDPGSEPDQKTMLVFVSISMLLQRRFSFLLHRLLHLHLLLEAIMSSTPGESCQRLHGVCPTWIVTFKEAFQIRTLQIYSTWEEK